MLSSKTSIAWLVAILIAAATTLVLGATALSSYRANERREMAQLRNDHTIEADQMALSLALPVWNLDRAQIDKIIEGNMRDREDFAIVVRLADVNNTVHARGRDALWNVVPLDHEPADKGLLKETRNIVAAGGDSLGTVTIFVTPQFLRADLKNSLEMTILEIAVLDVLLTAGLYALLWWLVLRPIRILERDATRVGAGAEARIVLKQRRFRGELESLRASLERMFGLLYTRYQQLQDSEERYRNLTAAAFEGIGISEDGRVVDVNDQMLKMFGYTREEMVGKKVTDLVAPESREVVAEAVRSGNESIYEHRLLRKDGSMFFAEARARMVKSGNRTLRMTALRDITERKISEGLNRTQADVLEMITRGEPLFKTLDVMLRQIEAQLPQMLCSILLLDAEGLRVRHGAAPSLPPDYIKGIDGQPIGPCAGSCGTAAYRGEAVYVSDIATDPLWVDYRELALAHGLRACWSTPIFDAQRKVLGTFAVYYRTPGTPTEQHRQLIEVATHTAAVCITKHNADKALQESEERFRALVEFSPDCIAVAVHERLVYMNPAGLKLIGAKNAGEVIGRNTQDFVPVELHETMRQRREKVLAESVSSPVMEIALIRLDGSLVTIESQAVPFVYAGQTAILNLMHDVTDRKRMEVERTELAARERKAREEFTRLLITSQEAERQRIAGELHDGIGQNLSIIKNRARLAQQQPPPTAAGHLEAIERVATDAIAETRNLARNLRPLHIQQVGLTDSLRELIREASESTPIHFERRVENVDDIFKDEAATNVYRVVQEALSNLIKHSSAEQASVTVERDVRSVRLRIADDGVGFEVNQAAAKGGLGLTSMTERVSMLGGTMRIETSPGRGTQLMVELPFVEREQETPAETAT
jgi:PAS domain S-box-containing protein